MIHKMSHVPVVGSTYTFNSRLDQKMIETEVVREFGSRNDNSDDCEFPSWGIDIEPEQDLVEMFAY